MDVSDCSEREAVREFLADATEENFLGVFRALHAKLIRYFFVRGVDIATAEDLTQDVLMTVYSRADSLRNKETFFGWLFKIAANRHSQYLRRRRHRPKTVELAEHVVAGSLRTDNHELQQKGEFLHLMNLLEPVERQIMTLRYIEELGYQEIATALEMPLGTVKWRIFHAKEILSAYRRKERP
jgi:RNA polymerase sigma-70 factor (ECF subfamily)